MVTQIQASDMDPDVKQAQIDYAKATASSTINWLSTVYSNAPGWSQEWATFSVEG